MFLETVDVHNLEFEESTKRSMCIVPRKKEERLKKQIRWQDEVGSQGRKVSNKLPTSRDVCQALSRLEVDDDDESISSDTSESSEIEVLLNASKKSLHYRYRRRKEEALNALGQLSHWTLLREAYIGAFVDDFVDYGGVARLLDFLSHDTTGSDPHCVERATWLIVELLFVTNKYTRTRTMGVEIVKTIIKRNGIRIMIANLLSLKFGEESSMAIANTWRALGRIVSKNTLKRIDRVDQIVMLHAASCCLGEIDNLDIVEKEMRWVMDILRPLLFIVGNTMNDSTSITARDYHQRKIVSVSLKALRWEGNRWNDNKIVIENAIFLFCVSSKKGLLVNREDCESILPFSVHCLTTIMAADASTSATRRKVDERIVLDALKLLEALCSIVGEISLETSGALRAVTSCYETIAQRGSSTIKTKALEIMEKIMNRTQVTISNPMLSFRKKSAGNIIIS